MAGRRGGLLAGAVAAVLACGAVLAAGRGEGPAAPVQVVLEDRERDLALFHQLDLDVDGVFGTWARVYLIPEEAEKLEALGYSLASLPEEHERPGDAAAASYHTYETLTAELQDVAADHPQIVRLTSIGRSVQGRELWMVKISRNPDLDEDEPEVRYIAAMHGDEVVGKEMCVNLIHLLTDGYGSDPRVTALVDSTEIWILPSMNPDGTAQQRRYNANFYDLNRNFPDQFRDPTDSPAGRQPETQHVMNWGYAHAVDLSANFHGGAVVANYPYDGTASGASVYSLSPDDGLFVSLARTYADANPPMAVSNADPSFDRGICNGADWYVIDGGMQDWNYVWRGGHDITLEISASKWPAASTLASYWDDNRESMLAFLERVHEGVRGVVTDALTGLPLRARIRPLDRAGNGAHTWSDPDVGDYHRMLLPGRYDLEIAADGHATAILRDVVVPGGAAVRWDVALEPLATRLEHHAHRILDGAGGDGSISPGEAADLAVTLRDAGLAASGVEATLEPAGWFSEVLVPDAAYPDIPGGGTAESLPPHHRVAAPPGAPAGHKLGFALRWSSAEGSGETAPFFVPVGAASCVTVASTDVPRTLPDRSTVQSVLALATDLEIADVDVFVDVAHTYVGDLHLTLLSPAGTPVALHSRSGGSSDDIVGWYDDTRTPSEPLSRVRGEHAGGTWTLRVNDGVPANTGTLRGWSLRACGRPFETATPRILLRDVSRESSGARLAWWPYPGLTSYRVYRSTTTAQPSSFVDVTAEDPDVADTRFHDGTSAPLVMWLVTGVGPGGEGPR